MKMKVLLADDEPSALRSLQFVIETHFADCEIVYCAQNGQEALEKANILQPDILITDVKMPLLDGIGLVEKLRLSCPATNAVIVSGYQDFEYAQGALRSGVVDYLLKPLDVGQLCSLLEALYQKKSREYYLERVSIITRYIYQSDGNFSDRPYTARYLPFTGYTAALVRINGLPSRFTTRKMSSWRDPVKKTMNPVGPSETRGAWIIEGRDDMEYFVFRAEKICTSSLKDILHSTPAGLSTTRYTAVLAQEPFRPEDFHCMARRMWRVMDNRLVLGCTQFICLAGNEPQTPRDSFILDKVIETRIAYLISEGMYDDLKCELINLFNCWESEKCPQLRVEQYIRQIIRIVSRRVSSSPEIQAEIDLILDEALSYSTTFGELLENIWQIIEEITRKRTDRSIKVDTSAFFGLIEKHVKENLKEALSLASVCSHMGISQTYLSRLFRKYTHMSFNKYITVKRIEEAKRLMDKTAMPVQDIAFAVGYDNPSYFSKVFRDIVGKTPSEYSVGKNPSPFLGNHS